MIFLLVVLVVASSIVLAYPRTVESMSNLNDAAPLGWNMGQGLGGESWESRADQYAAKMGYTESTKMFQQFQGTPVPLPEGQLDFFANNKFMISAYSLRWFYKQTKKEYYEKKN